MSASLGAILRNCQPEDGKIHVYGDTVYVQPATDPESLRLKVADGNLYQKLFIFKSPCDVSFEAISLRYYGTCSVSVSYGSDHRVLEILQFPDPPTGHWHSRNVSLTKSASQSLHSFMKRYTTSELLITISPGISRCQLYKVDHNTVKGLIIIGHGKALKYGVSQLLFTSDAKVYSHIRNILGYLHQKENSNSASSIGVLCHLNICFASLYYAAPTMNHL